MDCAPRGSRGVLAEAIGTNLYRKKAVTFDDIRAIQVAVARYDKLCLQEFLPAHDQWFFHDIYRLSNTADVPYLGRDNSRTLQKGLELFLTVRSKFQIEFVSDQNEDILEIIYKTPDLSSGWSITIPLRFTDFAFGNISALVEQNSESNESTIQLSLATFCRWVTATGKRLSIPDEIVAGALKNTDILTSAALAGLLECHYYAQRAHGAKSRVRENDGRDIAIGGYAGLSTLIVTDDGPLIRLLQGVLGDPRRAIGFDAFIEGAGTVSPMPRDSEH